jgi:site-specific DNA-methyltransferase (adenine-specific)
MSVRIEHGDCLEVLPRLAAEGVRADACVTDPPYHLTSIVKRFGKPNAKPTRDGDVYARSSAGFMGKAWDGGDVAFRPETWAAVGACLKPGAHLLAFGGTRTFHRTACAIEDAGFEIRDCVMWLYGSGFPKSHDVAKAIDKAAGVAVPKKQPGGVASTPTGMDSTSHGGRDHRTFPFPVTPRHGTAGALP